MSSQSDPASAFSLVEGGPLYRLARTVGLTGGVAGLIRIGLALAFFTWHDRIEEQHKVHVWDELRDCYESPKFREQPFITAGVKMLDGVKVFWDGLDQERRRTGKFAA